MGRSIILKKNIKNNNKKTKKVFNDSGFKLAESVSVIKESEFPLSRKVGLAYAATVAEEVAHSAKRTGKLGAEEGRYCPKTKPGTCWAYNPHEKNA